MTEALRVLCWPGGGKLTNGRYPKLFPAGRDVTEGHGGVWLLVEPHELASFLCDVREGSHPADLEAFRTY